MEDRSASDLRSDGPKAALSQRTQTACASADACQLRASAKVATNRAVNCNPLLEHLQASLRQKNLLLKDLRHQFRNNLQFVSSLLGLQADLAADPLLSRRLRGSQQRIRCMAIISEHLYQDEHLQGVSTHKYLAAVVESLLELHKLQAARIQVRAQVADVLLSPDQAIPCGLIVNELVSNSILHAFDGRRPGQVDVKLHVADSRIVLTVSDNGLGLPTGLDPARSPRLGLRLVSMLVEQLKGVLEVQPTPAATFKIVFPHAQLASKEAGHGE